MSDDTSTLVGDFQRYFSVDLANREEARRKCFGIRYRVYCDEFGYEPTAAFPDQLESDEFDDDSIHCLITHRSSGMPAGCVRLVLSDSKTLLPMEQFCGESLSPDFFRDLGAQRDQYCEFSRFAVDGAFRRRSGEKLTRYGEIAALDCTRREQRTFSLIAVCAFIAGFAVAELSGRKHCFAMMEPFLPRMLRRSGVKAQACGESLDYHGTRCAYHIRHDVALAGMRPELLDLYNDVLTGFRQQWVAPVTPPMEPAAAGSRSLRQALQSARDEIVPVCPWPLAPVPGW